MPKITFLHKDGRKSEIEVEKRQSVMQIATENGIEEIEGACGGCVSCATCHIYVDPAWEDKVNELSGEKSDEEEDLLDIAYDVRDTSRLGCQISLRDELDGLVVALPGTPVDW